MRFVEHGEPLLFGLGRRLLLPQHDSLALCQTALRNSMTLLLQRLGHGRDDVSTRPRRAPNAVLLGLR